MEKKLLLLLILIAVLVAPIGYIALLINWLTDYTRGVFNYKPVEVMGETMVLFIYTYFGIRFFNRHVNSLR